MARGSIRCGARTTFRAEATWARFRTGSPASSMWKSPSFERNSSGAGEPDPAEARLAHVGNVRGDGTRRIPALYVLGENPLQSEADQAQTRHRLESLDLLIVQDIFLTATAEMADVVFPAAAGWCESEGTVTNSERRVQRVPQALDPPGESQRRHRHPLRLARRMGHDWGQPAEKIWTKCAH